ncbi:hypothetical protein D3C81_1626310 [compost metagenome]
MPASMSVSGSRRSLSQRLTTRMANRPPKKIPIASRMSCGTMFRLPSILPPVSSQSPRLSSNSPGLVPEGVKASSTARNSNTVRPIPASIVLAWAWWRGARPKVDAKARPPG